MTPVLDFYNASLLLCAFGVLLTGLLLKSRHQLPLPPGPQGSLFSGVLANEIRTEPWKVYANWAKECASPLISFRVFNRRIVVLNDVKAILELFNKRASLYSDRPKAWMYHELCDRGKSVFNISSLGERHRQYRKMLAVGLGSRKNVQQYYTLLEAEIETLLDGLMTSPQSYEAHIRRNAAAVIMKVAYGYTISGTNDLFIQVADDASKISGWAMAPGRWLVDYFPILRFVPPWFPGASFRRQAEEWRKQLEALSDVPHRWTKEQMASGSYSESFTSRLLRPEGPGGSFVSPEEEDIIKWSAGGLYAGAADTTVSAILSFVLLMSINPDVQKKAQAEIETIVGKCQVPSVTDLDKLHYLQAVLKEVLRYAPVAPLALPHKVVADDEYAGYRIPKDATVMANVWAVMNDETVYPSPSIFDPNRFFPQSQDLSAHPEPEQPDPKIFSYGFGRRVCPGSQFSEPVMLISMASILAKFNIVCPSYDPVRGRAIQFTTGITSRIKPFPIEIQPRFI